MNIPEFDEIIEPNDQTEARAHHLEALRELVGNVYPNKFERSKFTGEEDTITNLLHFSAVKQVVDEIKRHISTLNEGERPHPEEKEALNAELRTFGNVRVSGRLTTTPRTMGKAAFVHLSDGKNRIQIYVRKDDVKGISNGGQREGEATPNSPLPTPDFVDGWDLFKLLDGGDFIGVEGYLFLTNTGELSIHVETLQFLSKSLLPMPDKMHGIADPELQRRYRYADLIASSLQVEHEGLTTREVFERRAKLISGMRRYLDDAGYIEVETPMLSPKATGAAARPFETYHNALDIPLYARIAPELYLKRLTVGGFEKVYELNRNFRNEGLSQKHNPEFTMLEFYCAYMDVNGMMDFAEAMIKEAVMKANNGSLVVKYGENEIDFGKFERISMKEAIAKVISKDVEKYNSSDPDVWLEDEGFQRRILAHRELKTRAFNSLHVSGWSDEELEKNRIAAENKIESEKFELWEKTKLFEHSMPTAEEAGFRVPDSIWQISVDRIMRRAENLQEVKENGLVYLFEEFVESDLIQPTFIIDYPKSISPLSKASPTNPNIAERFELFINGMECANGFSELNDPREQYERFVDQMSAREGGDDEAMVLDEDYIRALAYGMPPAAGIGIGIDRLVMLLTNKHSIRDVILFPHMKPIVKVEQTEE
ncbi:MAG: lysine--tRNA ligase [Pyrinomonadaceae bacterium]|nr:lysine--tRNA ligase [Pyrinomonadaceae bacterium]